MVKEKLDSPLSRHLELENQRLRESPESLLRFTRDLKYDIIIVI